MRVKTILSHIGSMMIVLEYDGSCMVNRPRMVAETQTLSNMHTLQMSKKGGKILIVNILIHMVKHM
jgi:hypothetical protein